MSQPSNDPTKHHYIPEFYLRWWTGDDGRLERYDRPYASKIMVSRRFPSEVGWIKNLYASPGDKRGEQWMENQVFQVIDSRAAPVLARMVREESYQPTGPERSAWTLFLRSLFHRTPETLRGTISNAIEIYDRALEEQREVYEVRRAANDPPTFEEFVAQMTTDERRKAALRSIPSIMMNPKIGQFLHDMPTSVITLPDGTPDFLLSDDPLARTNGLKREDGHIAIPLSPRRLFVSAYRQPFLDYVVKMNPKELVTTMNTWTVESARYFVAAPDRKQDRFIRNRFGTSPKPPLLKAR